MRSLSPLRAELLDRNPVDATRACEYAQPIPVLLHTLARLHALTALKRSLFMFSSMLAFPVRTKLKLIQQTRTRKFPAEKNFALDLKHKGTRPG